MPNPVGPVIYSIEVSGKVVPEFPLDTELRQCWSMHDLFFIRIEIPRNTSSSKIKIWKDNAPVKIIYGRRPSNIQTWYGYVNHHNISGNSDSGSHALQITYCCIGTSKPMNTDKNRSWGNVTPTYIARKIAAEHGFRAVLTKTNWILPYEVQSNESDFVFLCRLAKKVGFRFWVSGSTLYFIDPAAVLSGTSHQAVPVFRLDKLFTNLDTIRHFSMNEGDNLPGSVIAKRSAFGLDEASGNVYRVFADANQTSAVSHIQSDHFIPTIDHGKKSVEAFQSLNQFWLCATAELYGNTFIYPGKLIHLEGKQLPTDAQGSWLVSSATHVLKKSGTTYGVADKYVSQVELIKNSPNFFPHVKRVQTLTPEFVPCRLSKGSWVSEQVSVFYDGVISV